MEISEIKKPTFYVLGKEDSANSNPNISKSMWQEVNNHFNEVRNLIKWNESGEILGMWGIITNHNHNFEVEKNSQNYYLAGFECDENTKAPNGWTKIQVPGFSYLKVKLENAYTFNETVQYMINSKLNLVGMIQNYIDAKTGEMYLLFPFKKID